jgi:DNA polymerase III epsilon subunit-like protein
MKLDTFYNIFIFDTETTGNESKDRLCQLAYKNMTENFIFNELFLPPVPMTVVSQAVHHITPKMVADKPAFIESSHFENIKNIFEDAKNILVAHNAKFDVEMLSREGIVCKNVIDTLKIVRHLDPDMKIERHNLQYLRYLLELDNDIEEKIQAHDAKGDVLILEKLFIRLFKKMRENFSSDEETLEKMIEISKNPSLIRKFNFGKYNGSFLADVIVRDRGYLEWLLKTKKESDQDEEDWIYTLEHFLDIK